MSKIGFTRLSRGVKFLTYHVHDQVQRALSRITFDGFEANELETGAGSFRVNVSIPHVSPSIFQHSSVGGDPKMRTCAGFALPPFQEDFDSGGHVGKSTPVYILESVSFSIDQQATPFATRLSDGALSIDDSDKVSFDLLIQRKPADVLGGKVLTAGGIAIVPPKMDNVVLSVSYPNGVWNNENIRGNPGVSSDFDMVFDPYSVYLLSVNCGSLANAPAQPLRVDSLLVSLKFRTQLRARDSGVGIQNMPEFPDVSAANYGARYTVPENVVIPAAGALIVADATVTDDGTSGAIEKVDKKFLSGMLGGYTSRSRRWGPSNIKHDAGYEVISVPMWGNGWYAKGSGGGWDVDSTPLGNLPYSGAAPFIRDVGDRRIVPIKFPFVLHHVIAFINYSGKPLLGAFGDKAMDYSLGNQWSSAASATLEHEIGIGIGTGIRGDIRSTRNVAHAVWNRSTVDSYRISRMEYADPVDGAPYCQGDLLSIPLVYPAGDPGSGYDSSVTAALSDTGKPVFIGQTNSPDITRAPMADIPNGAVTALNQDGYEQFIEIRWNIRQALAGLDLLDNDEVIIGQGGFQVYLIGKKHLC